LGCEIRHLLHHLPRLGHVSSKHHYVGPLLAEELERRSSGKLVSRKVDVRHLSNPKAAQRIGKANDPYLVATQQDSVGLQAKGIGGNRGACRADTGEKAPAGEIHQLPRRP
jgi:hypothetical protein